MGKKFLWLIITFVQVCFSSVLAQKYVEKSHPTPNYAVGKTNAVKGVILHHTAEPTIEKSLGVLTNRKKGVGTHCVIDTDGTRYIMCSPTVVTYHAGFSLLNGKEGCNNFTLGIEYGSTAKRATFPVIISNN